MQKLKKPSFLVEFERAEVLAPVPRSGFDVEAFLVPVKVRMLVTATDVLGNSENYEHTVQLRYSCTASPGATNRRLVSETRRSIESVEPSEAPYEPEALFAALYVFDPEITELSSALFSRVAMEIEHKRRQIDQLTEFIDNFKKAAE